MKNPDIKNLRVAVVPTETGNNIDQSSSVEEILACSETELYPITDYFQAQNDEQLGLHWSFLIDMSTKEEWTGSNIEGIHQFNEVEPLYSVKFWKNKTEYNRGNAVFLQDDYTLKDTEIVVDAIKNLVYAYEIFYTESGETYYHSME